ncbi:MAG TPA: hypothetical protein PKN96_10505 [Flavobacterium sp.]|uniref:hypothetical protein n=1 Tax=Flavobacterium sp. TaxID=239 RepID=UPI002BEAA251|nr:hypothetical protein [Flavobacterium sp.]HNP33711.1 hypothetical protein [Flavobacterium sp.]
MIRSISTFLALTLSILVFGQEKNSQKWEKVISEMTKAKEGDTITYRSKQNLEWSDFKMTPPPNSNMKAYLELTFGVFVKKVNYWSGVISIDSYGGMRRDLSWVNSQQVSQKLLDYLQLKYEIAHYFAEKSEKEINSKKINAGNTDKINGIIEARLSERDKALNDFDIESDFGNNAEIIEKWKQKLHDGGI